MNTLRAIAVAFAFAGLALAQSAAPATSSSQAVPAAHAQTSARPAGPPLTAPKDTAKAEDVQSVEATVGALYDVISGAAGPRNWDRLRSLFLPEANMTVTVKREDGSEVFRVLTVEDYISRAGPSLEKEGFFEHSIANKIDTYGSIAQVFSTYESRHKKDGEPFARGINSIQLVRGWGRWWITNLVWDSERPDNRIPEKYLK